jgi:hypothetical protein
MPRAVRRRKPSTKKEDAVALLEQEAVRFAESLDDYEHVTVTDMGGDGPTAFWVVVHDQRLGLSYRIRSHCDYWDFVGALIDHRQCLSLRPLEDVA